MKRLVSVVLSVALLIGCFGLNAFAEEQEYPRVNHTYTTTEDSASDAWSAIRRGQYLSSGSCTIARNGYKSINISGDTNGTQTCDNIKLYLYVERSTSYATGYSTYKDYVFDADDVYTIEKEISNIPVERGYYYRVTGVHSVTKGNTTEVTDSVTNPLNYL